MFLTISLILDGETPIHDPKCDQQDPSPAGAGPFGAKYTYVYSLPD